MKDLYLIIAFVITMILILVAVFSYTYFIGWTQFAFTTGQPLIFNGPADKLRFKNVKFTYGSYPAADVTANMNAVSTSYRTSTTPPQSLNFGYLNLYSFPVNGLNDTTTIPDPSKLCTLSSCSSTCKYGDCESGQCKICDNSLLTTLTGFYKVL